AVLRPAGGFTNSNAVVCVIGDPRVCLCLRQGWAFVAASEGKVAENPRLLKPSKIYSFSVLTCKAGGALMGPLASP
ncbi:hypothetical protein ABTL40_19585, partial [Acinetobacter baumannii]